MDHHRQRHHHNPNPQFMDSRYFPVRPISRPPFHGDPILLTHPPPRPQHHHHNLPPPPPPPQLPPQPRPPQYPLPQRPTPPQYHQPLHEGNFVNYNHSQPCRPRVSSNQGVLYDHHQYRGDDRQQFYLPEPPRVSPLASIAPPISNVVGLDRNHEVAVHRPVEFNHMSPPFREIDEFSHEFRSDELRDWRDDRRIMEIMERERAQGRHFHDEYQPEMFPREFEMNSGGGEFMREDGEVLVRDDRDGIMMDDDINVRYDINIQAPPSRDVSCSPLKFRNRGTDRDDGYGEFYEEGMNRGPESGRYYDRGRRQEIPQDYNRTPRKNARKKSALLRIQPSKHTSFRNRQDTTLSPSPHEGKESLEGLDHRLSEEERDGSPVELDVSFKSNSLVAKAIMAAPSGSVIDPNDNAILNDLGIGIDSKSPAKADSNRNCRKVEKYSENRVRSSPTLNRGGLPSNMCGSNSELPSSGSSTLNGGSTHRGSPKGEVSNKDDTNVGLGKVPPFSIRKKRKPNILLSRLSSSPSKTNVKLVKASNSVDHPSGSSMPVDCLKETGNESSSDRQVVGSTQNEAIIGVENMDVDGSPIAIVQPVGYTVSDAPFRKRMRKKGISESPLDSSGQLGPSLSEATGKTNKCSENMQTISNTDEDVTKSGDKCISDTSTEGHGHGSQIMVPVLVDNGSGEGSSKPLISVGGNEDDVDIISVDLDNHDTLDIGNSTSVPFDAPVKIPDRVEVTCSVADKPCRTQVISSPENGMIGKPCGEECFDGDDNNRNEMEIHDFLLNSSKATISSDKTITPFSHDDFGVYSEKLTTAPGHKATNNIQEQQCRGEGTVLVSGAESEGPSKAFISEAGDLILGSTEEDAPGPVLNRKRKSRNEIQYLNVGISGSSHDNAGSKSILMMKSNLPVEKLGSIVLGLPCWTSESVPQQKGLKNSCPESITSMNHGHDSYAIECPSHHRKKNKITPLESSDSSASQNCDLPASSDSLISTAEVRLNSVEHSTQSEGGIQLSNTVLVEEIIVGGSTNRLQTTRYSFADDSSADLPHGDPCLLVNEDAHLDGGLSSVLPKQEGNVNLVMGGAIDGSKSMALESEGRITTSYQSGGIHCMEIDHIGDSVHEPRVTDIGSENNVAVNDNLPSESDPPHLHAECTDDGATTDFDMVTARSIVGSSKAGSSLTHSSHLETVSALNLLSDGKLAIVAKRSSKRLVTQGSLSSHSNSIVKSNATNSKPGISAAPTADQPFAKKYVVPAKNAKTTTSHVIPISRQFIRRNVLVRADGNSSSARASPITALSNKAPSTYPVKPRTWRRTDNLPASNTPVKKPSLSTPLQRPPIDRTMKVQSTSYIRKGNILVRNPASGAATPGPRVVGASLNQSKANAANNTSKITGSREMTDSTVVPDSLMVGGQNTHVEMPKTPPLPCSGLTSDHEIGYSGDCRSSRPEGQPEATDNEEVRKSSVTTPSSSRNPETDVDRSLEDPGTLSDGNFSASNLKRVVYVKRKSNQLIAASNSIKLSVHKVDKAPALSSDNGYYKRRKNQLVRASSESNIQQMVAKTGDSFNSHPQKALNVYSGRNSTKRQSNKVKPRKVSLVWKLGDTKSSGKGVDPLRCGKILSHLLPWKRATYWRSVWRSSTNFSSNSSLMITRKLLSSRKRAAVYVRSGRGFSLRRSKVISLGGSSLKWSKSMEKRSKKVDEEAAQATAAMHSPKTGASGERIFRIGTFRYRMDPSRRTLQRIAEEGSSNAATSKTEHGARKTYVPKRLLIGSDEYVRIGNGNQLVRDPKRRTRLLASEKVRWSLHTARMRLAKKRKFCQFFTRFGKCNKGEGKCPYIHDPSKIAVCTKFLKGLCSDPSCKLTHKVIPERMPDCSFFLQGSCSNENCPYRHVNVNPKAPICESFLRGYCAKGNECRKKHSYICPEFEATGNCPEGSKCKLYHPKKGGKGKKRKTSKNQVNSNSRGRYFGPGLATTSDQERDMAEKPEKRIAPKDGLQETEELGDFIGLDVSDDELWENNDTIAEPMSFCESEAVNSQLDDLDELITPLRILDSH